MTNQQAHERRATPRYKPETLCYARVYCLISRGWVTHDGLVADISETHIRLCSDMPTAEEYRLCHQERSDVRRAREIRRDGSGVVFEIGEPVEQPQVVSISNDFSFLDPHYALFNHMY